MKRFALIVIALICCLCINAEVKVKMEYEQGVYKIPCMVNGLKLKFFFDTGASQVCLSQAYAEMMLENGYLNESDILGTKSMMLADGSTVNCVTINLRSLEIGGIELENVEAAVVQSQNAPMLLGQSVIQRLGKVSIDGDYLVIHNANVYSDEELDEIFNEAKQLYDQSIYLKAIEYFKIIYDAYGEDTNPNVLFRIGTSYWHLNDETNAIKFFHIALDLDEDYDTPQIDRFSTYCLLSICYETLNDIRPACESAKMQLKYAKNQSDKANAYMQIGCTCSDYSDGIDYFNKAINLYKTLESNHKLSLLDKHLYSYSLVQKGVYLENLGRSQEAIDTLNIAAKKLNSWKNEDFYPELINVVNLTLSRCYHNLVK